MSVFEMPEFDRHEEVLFHHDALTGLNAILAIHSTVLGPAAGGCRMWAYASSSEAVTDVLRLSRGMSYKNAMAGLAFGGGKAVIIADPKRPKTPELFEAYGRFVNSFGGRYITAEDVGTTTTDMETVARQTRYVSGLSRHAGDVGGDPGPKTAVGVYLGLKAAAKFRLGRADLQDLKVAVQGLGGVGYHLCRLLAAEGARLFVADVRAAATERAADEWGAVPVAAQDILHQDVEIFAPCAPF
jgi:leucine dehydrogenase